MHHFNEIKSFLDHHSKKKKVIVIYGPTACGKTSLWLEVAEKIGSQIISTDSRQIYKWMDIGTGKVTKKEMGNIVHHMIDVASPDEVYSVGKYKKEALKIMKHMWAQGDIPILVWGTWLYIDALIYNFNIPKAPKSLKIREKYEKMAAKYGNEFVYKKLQKIDPDYAKEVHPNNLQYVIRGIEVKLSIGRSKLEFKKEKKLKYETLFLTPYADAQRAQLYEKINLRVSQMFAQWLVKEVKKIVKKYGENAPWLEAIGYTEVIEFLEGKISEKQCLDQIQQHSRNYAKRQITWFRKYA